MAAVVELDNPAGRLWQVFTSLQEFVRNDTNITTGDGFGKLLGISYTDHPLEVLERVGEIARLPRQIREQVAALPIDGSLALRRLGEFEGALDRVHLPQVLRDMVGVISEAGMEHLEMCSSMLHQYLPERRLAPPQTKEVRDSIETLIADVRADTALDGEVRRFLLGHLHEMLRAIDDFDIVGASALEHAVQRAVGETVLATMSGSVHAQTEKTSRFWEIVTKLAVLLTVLQQGVALTEAVAPQLLPVKQQSPATVVEINGEPVTSESPP